MHQEGHEIPAVQLQDLAQPLEYTFDVAQLSPDDAQVEPKADVARVAGKRLQKHRLGAFHVARRHGPHGRLVRARDLFLHGGG